MSDRVALNAKHTLSECYLDGTKYSTLQVNEVQILILYINFVGEGIFALP